MIIRIAFLVFLSIMLEACSSTTVVLVPDPGGKVGQVSVTTQGGTTLLSKTNESTQLTIAEEAPSQPVVLSEQDIQKQFAGILSKEPKPPQHFSLYFSTGSSDISTEAKSQIETIVAAIQSRHSCDLSVIGHSDRVGDNESNRGISLQRAEMVSKTLIANGISSQCMDIRYYGENDPAVPTDDNVPEARNRRVEVEIR
ncbi:OmpA family protein [Methylomonas sp. AM2-LC]|uniref:OmpA family protein n=1 Tax=Methylomonas sp. AM2-LC TaxID=3153301 RepID=UPI00326735B6